MSEPNEELKVESPAVEEPLPEKTSTTQKLTYTAPHILKAISRDEGGFVNTNLRQGGSRQIEFETTVEFSEKSVDEQADLFVIRATNQVNFANQVINVINDETDIPDLRLVPTSPTAAEYLEKVGTRVMIASRSIVDKGLSDKHGKNIYRIARIFIMLP